MAIFHEGCFVNGNDLCLNLIYIEKIYYMIWKLVLFLFCKMVNTLSFLTNYDPVADLYFFLLFLISHW